ncbi:MAG: hypothetical protein FD144_3836 [Rhodospirillaceae bacterium]|nr:MAG: hypothetical protein FD144_3836 [Rhodospirillaceae bacterium]
MSLASLKDTKLAEPDNVWDHCRMSKRCRALSAVKSSCPVSGWKLTSETMAGPDVRYSKIKRPSTADHNLTADPSAPVPFAPLVTKMGNVGCHATEDTGLYAPEIANFSRPLTTSQIRIGCGSCGCSDEAPEVSHWPFGLHAIDAMPGAWPGSIRSIFRALRSTRAIGLRRIGPEPLSMALNAIWAPGPAAIRRAEAPGNVGTASTNSAFFKSK